MDQPTTEKQPTPSRASQTAEAEKDPLVAGPTSTAPTTPPAADPQPAQEQSTTEFLMTGALVVVLIVAAMLFIFTLLVSAVSAGRYIFYTLTPGGHTLCLPDNQGGVCVTWSADAVDGRAYGETHAVQLNAAVAQACEEYCREKEEGRVCSGVYVGKSIGAKTGTGIGQMNACKVAPVGGV